MFDTRDEIITYLDELYTTKKEVIKYRPNREDELMHCSYGYMAVLYFLNTINNNRTTSIRFLLERRISELNTLINNSKNKDQRLLYSIQIDYLTDLYDSIIII